MKQYSAEIWMDDDNRCDGTLLVMGNNAQEALENLNKLKHIRYGGPFHFRNLHIIDEQPSEGAKQSWNTEIAEVNDKIKQQEIAFMAQMESHKARWDYKLLKWFHDLFI